MARSARRPGRQAQIAGLLLALLLGLGEAWSAGACASIGAPPGGPPDTTPPKILAVSPESGAVVPNLSGDAVIQFDEVIEEMAGSGGAGLSPLAKQVLLSPVAGEVKVSWHRTRVTIKPKEGWKKRAYRLEILPGFTDLRRNRTLARKTVLFTTGPEIGHARLGGIALKWIDQQVLLHALIEAVPLPDSVGYLTMADSGGQFNLTNLPPGRYIVYATADENGDRHRGLREAYDSTIVTLDSTSNVALYTFPHDTVPPKPRSATYVDSITIRVEFSQALDATQPFDTAHVEVLALPDSARVPIDRILTERLYDSLTTLARQKAESASAAARDTGRVHGMVHDTSAQPNIHPTVPPAAAPGPRRAAPAPPPPPPPPPPAAAARPRVPAEPAVDTALVRRLLAQRPVPSDKIVIGMVRPLKPETRYVVRVRGATNLIGRKGDGVIGFTTPKPRAPADTTHRTPRTPPPRRRP
jgi:hypothetical protein